ncbi:MAG: PEGA domain-containing protein [Acidobacteriia bacterium]|nr:PEGA domain-containing protein [Terriglobia bacterium]
MLTESVSFLRTCRKAAWVIAALIVCASSFSTTSVGRPAKPLSKAEIIDLLKSDVPPARVEELVAEKGMAFRMTAQTERELRAAGANDSLLRALRAAAPRGPASSSSRRATRPTPETEPRAASPAVLFVQSTPGGAQVYVDDEPVGTTSAGGVLKLSRLAAGEHSVRVSLAGYEDHQETAELISGETVHVAANLTAAAAMSGSGAGSEESVAAPNVRPGESYFAALGIVTPESQPEDYMVVDVLEVAPGSPADRVGLHSACAILTLAGVRVTSPQELRRVLSQHRSGETVEITFSDGSLNHTARVRLAVNTPPLRAR